jgi:NADH-quinone oxidoreductase subunit J
MNELAGAPAGGAAAIAFWISAALAVFGAVAVVLSRRTIRSAVFLLLNVLSLAALFALLDAHLLAALQVIVYAGAVVVLFVFVIMLLGPSAEQRSPRSRRPFVPIVGGALLLFVGVIVLRAVWGLAPEAELPEGFGTVKTMAGALFRDNVLAFEAVSVLLLVAIVGAVAVAKVRRAPRPVEGTGGTDVRDGGTPARSSRSATT